MQHHLIHSPQEASGAYGIFSLRSYPAGFLAKVQALLQENDIDRARWMLSEGKLELESRNLIMQAAGYGKDLIIQRLIGINTHSLNLAFAEIGTGTTTPAITDIALTTPIARAATANGLSSDIGNNQAQLQWFFPDNALANDVYAEVGTFVDGTATIGTGQIFNHALLATTYTKAAGTDITLQANITIT